jgi:hypothetical protein
MGLQHHRKLPNADGGLRHVGLVDLTAGVDDAPQSEIRIPQYTRR